MLSRRLFITAGTARHFSVSCVRQKHASAYVGRQGRFMKKLLQGSQPKKKSKWYTNDAPPKISHETGDKLVPYHVSRRMTVLNKIFMEHITDLMSTGEMSPFLVNRNIEITHVKIAPDFNIMNVFWMDSNNNPENHAGTKEVLQLCGHRLRHELSQLRVIGRVPPIQFVECKHASVEKEVERRLKIADYGEEFDRCLYPFSPTNVVSYRSDSKTDITAGDEEENLEENFYITVPTMRNDVFGLDHHKIMSKITSSLSKLKKTAWKRELNHQSVSQDSDLRNRQSIPDLREGSQEEEQEEFNKFLIKMQKEERRKYKLKNPKVRSEDIIRFMRQEEDDLNNIENDADDFDNELEEHEEDEH